MMRHPRPEAWGARCPPSTRPPTLRLLFPALWALLAAAAASGQSTISAMSDAGLQGGPTFREILSLQAVYNADISPDGAHVAYTLQVADWEQNRNVVELWVVSGGASPRRVATEQDGFSFSAQWTPDSRWLAFRARGDEPRLRLVSFDGRRSRDVALGVEGAGSVRFSPDGAWIALLAPDPVRERAAREQELYGPFELRDEDRRMTHVWLVGVEEGAGAPLKLTEGDFTVTDLAWSPDGTRIAFVHRPDPGRNSWWKADVSVVDLSTGRITPLAAEAGPDRAPLWSPDGRSVAFLSTLSDSITNLPMELAVAPAEGGEARVLTGDLPTEPSPVAWTERGVFLTALVGVERHLFRLDTVDGSLIRLTSSPFLVRDASVTPDGTAVAFTAATPDRLPDVYRAGIEPFEPRTLTRMTDQVADWEVGTREVVRWSGPGGVPIEGVLHKPTDYDAGRRYPLLIIVHGGPRAVSTPALSLSSGVYPVAHFLRKGALVLQPNYRGSTGYGGAFRQLHGEGVGHGDAGDVEAGALHLVEQGLVDSGRMGVMGWSYGGFISAWLTATSDRFQAISVGAGISDWPTHYAWEPASYTTRFYSFGGAPPFEDPERWAEASPITHVADASTPTLIQHVDGDPVVTVLNAYELQHALQDLGVEHRFVIYPGSGHGVAPLKQRLGALWHNWQWFLKHIWGEDVELPLE